MGHARRTITILTAAVAVALSLAGVSTADAAPTPSPTAAANASQNVIVVLRDQLASTPANKHDMSPRRTRATSAQDAVLSRLTGTAPTRVKHFALGNAFSATVSEAQAAALAQDPQVASVIPDRTVAIAQPTPAASSTTKPAAVAPPANANGPFALCPSDPAQPLVEPEALQSIRALTTDGSSECPAVGHRVGSQGGLHC